MRNRHTPNLTNVFLAAALAASVQAAFGQLSGRNLFAAGEGDQVAFVKSALDQGLPADLGGDVSSLMHIRPAVLVPLIEQKIEEVLRSPDPAQCFTAKDVDPKRFVIEAAATIAYAGDENGLRAVAKLIRVDEEQFGRYATMTVGSAYHFGNPMTLAYRGLGLDDPVLEKYVLVWVAENISDASVRRFWAESLVERYGRAPLDYQWESDPIVSRLPKEAAKAHDEVARLANEIVAKRVRKQGARSGGSGRSFARFGSFSWVC